MFRSTSDFDKQLEKATSHLLLEPDWQSIIQICDIICQGDCQPKYAISAIKKRFYNQNPYVALYALQVLESVVKNCGSPIHEEVATKAFMDELREMVHKTTNDNVRSKILELVQTWSSAFRASPKYRIVSDTLNILKAEGYTFPALHESDAMFAADRAPNWIDGDNCHRCRVQFSLVVRKHHCRACGQVFCGKCTPRSCTLPKFGIEKEVRVCEDCFEKHNTDSSTRPAKDDLDSPQGKSGANSAEAKLEKSRKEEELKLQEEEELQLAIALSRSEAEHKDKERTKSAPAQSSRSSYGSPVKQESPSVKMTTASEIDDPELARYLNRSYWEQRQQQEKENIRIDRAERDKEKEKSTNESMMHHPSAPVTTAVVSSPNNALKITEYQNGETEELDDFTATLSSQLDIFVNRMKSNSSRGRSIANDSSVQTLFLNIMAMHSKLIQAIQQTEESRVYYEGLQDKLTQARDARAALDALREEHSERLRREAEEAERQRQMQMAQKLEIMRKKKQEYLQYQRQLAMQRMQDEEREMQMRIEQQKQLYLRGPPMANVPMAPGMPPMAMAPGYPSVQQAQYGPMSPPAAVGMQPGPYTHENHPVPPYHPVGPSYALPSTSTTLQQVPLPQAGTMPGAYGPHQGHLPYAPYPQVMYPPQQPASAPTAYAPSAAPPGHPQIMMSPPQHHQHPHHQPQQHPPMENQQSQPAVAELISFD